MSSTQERLRAAVQAASERWERVDDAQAELRPANGGWSAKQVLGHLIDSAHNNHGRFVRAQLVDHLEFEGYDQDAWIELQRYELAPWAELLTLWRAYNLHLARVVAAVPVAVRTAPRVRHALDLIAWRAVPADRPATLGEFMDDYVGHLEHHVAQLDALLATARQGGGSA